MADAKFGGQFYKAHVRGANGQVEEQGVWNLDTPFVSESDNQDVLNYISASLNYLHDRMQTGNVNDRLQAIAANVDANKTEVSEQIAALSTAIQETKAIADKNKKDFEGIDDINNKIQLMQSTISRVEQTVNSLQAKIFELERTSIDINDVNNTIQEQIELLSNRIDARLTSLEIRVGR